MNSTKFMKRWIKASFIKTLKPMCEQGFEMFIEGEDRLTSKVTKHIELRIDGPYTTPCGTRGEMKAFIEVNLLGMCSRDESNVFNRENLEGLLAYMLNRDICIYRTGNVGKVSEDDESLVGTMILLPADMIKTSDFGMVDTNTEVYQCVSEAHYHMYYRE